jgi:hypothetical protein
VVLATATYQQAGGGVKPGKKFSLEKNLFRVELGRSLKHGGSDSAHIAVKCLGTR